MKNENLKSSIKMVFNGFLTITTILLFAFGIMSLFLNADDPMRMGLPCVFPLQIIACSFPCACCTFVYYSKKDYSKLSFIIRCIIQFILLTGIVTGEGFLFGWIESFKDFLIVFIVFLFVYFGVWLVTCLIDKKTSDRINHALHYAKENEDKNE